MRKPKFSLRFLVKLFVSISFLTLLSITREFNYYDGSTKVLKQIRQTLKSEDEINSDIVETNLSFPTKRDMKYILLWTPCSHGCWGSSRPKRVENCYFTASRRNRKVEEFDALIFHVGEIWRPLDRFKLPTVRSPHQNYIMYSHE